MGDGTGTKDLADGVSLPGEEIADAHAVGVREPNWVRLLQVEVIPRRFQPQLRAACDAIDFLTPAMRGLTLGYGIFIRSDCWRDRLLVVHELVHVGQYERLGGIVPLLRSCLFECLTSDIPERLWNKKRLPSPRASAANNSQSRSDRLEHATAHPIKFQIFIARRSTILREGVRFPI